MRPLSSRHLLACILASTFPLAARATTRSYTGGDNSSFGTATNWSPNGIPSSGDILTVGNNAVSGLTGDLHVTLNGLFGTNSPITSVTFDSLALPAALVINETGGTLSTTTENLGVDAFGNTFNQGSGSANIASNLTIGMNAGSFDDFYNLSSAGTALTVTSNLNLGLSGNGNLTQSDGNVTVHNSTASAFLAIGVSSGGNGTYSLNSGNLTADFLRVGEAGTAVFNQSGGSLTVNGNAVVSTLGSTATYNYSGGTATFASGFSVGSSGTFNLKTGGSLPFNVTVASGGTFNFAGGSLGTGNIILNGGTLQLQGHSITDSSHISGTGTLQNGSPTTATTLTLSPATTDSFAGIIADGSTATMSVTLTTGTFTLSGSNTYSGGTNIVFPGILKAGKTNALSPNSTIFISGTLYLNGFDQTIGGLSGVSGSVNMGSSNLTVAQSSTTSYQNPLNGSGNFIKSSTGTLTLTDVFPFTGGFSVTGGTLAISNIISATAYSASNGGTLQLAFPVTLAPGVMNATGGNITFTGGFSPTIGDTSGSPATVTIGTAGTLTTGTSVTTINATGTVNLTGGTFNVDGDISVTGGAITQTGGTFTWAGSHAMTIQSAGKVSLVNGYTTPTNATITVTGAGSKFSQTTNALQINNGATLSVNSGASVFSNIFCVASIFNSTTGGTGNGTVTVDGINSSLVGDFAQCYLGTGGVGNLTFSGGATGSFFGFFIGTFLTAGDNGTLTVEGNATVTSTSLIRVAAAATSGTGAINVTGGTLTQTGASPIFIGAASLSTGTVTIGTAGTFTTGTGAITIGKTGTLTLQSGGTFNINGSLTNSGTVTLSGTQAWAASTTFTNSAGTATFNTDAGSASSSPLSIVLSAGTVVLNGAQHLHSLAINGGILGGHNTNALSLTIGTSPYTLAPSATLPATSTGTMTLHTLSTSAKTTLAFNLKTPGASNVNDEFVVSDFQGLSLNGGTIAITGSATGTSSLGYYKAILYISSIQGAGISSLTLPPIANNIAYTLDINHNPGFVDVHRGFIGDANDDGTVDLSDLSIILNNFASTTPNWTSGNFDNAPTIDLTDLSDVLNNFGTSIPSGFPPLQLTPARNPHTRTRLSRGSPAYHSSHPASPTHLTLFIRLG